MSGQCGLVLLSRCRFRFLLLAACLVLLLAGCGILVQWGFDGVQLIGRGLARLGRLTWQLCKVLWRIFSEAIRVIWRWVMAQTAVIWRYFMLGLREVWAVFAWLFKAGWYSMVQFWNEIYQVICSSLAGTGESGSHCLVRIEKTVSHHLAAARSSLAWFGPCASDGMGVAAHPLTGLLARCCSPGTYNLANTQIYQPNHRGSV